MYYQVIYGTKYISKLYMTKVNLTTYIGKLYTWPNIIRTHISDKGTFLKIYWKIIYLTKVHLTCWPLIILVLNKGELVEKITLNNVENTALPKDKKTDSSSDTNTMQILCRNTNIHCKKRVKCAKKWNEVQSVHNVHFTSGQE